MNLLHRYVFKSVAMACFMAVGLFAFVLLVGNVLRDVVGLIAGGQMGFGLFFRLIALLIPYVVAYALPLGILTGVLLVLGRLSAQREITAMRSAGLSLFQISAPIFFLALVGIVFSIVVNFYYAPLARTQYREELHQAIRVNPMNFIVERSFIRHFPGFVIYVGEKDGTRLQDVWLWEMDEQSRVTMFMRAEAGGLAFDSETESLLLTVERASTEIRSERDPEDLRTARPPLLFEYTTVRLPLEQILGRRTVKRKLSMMTFQEALAERASLRREMAADPEVDNRAAIIRVQMSIQERFANAYAILSLAMIAIPLGITIQRKETSANLGVALVLALSFYLAMVTLAWFERMPHLRPDLLMWVPNIVFQVTGIWLFLRTERR